MTNFETDLQSVDKSVNFELEREARYFCKTQQAKYVLRYIGDKQFFHFLNWKSSQENIENAQSYYARLIKIWS